MKNIKLSLLVVFASTFTFVSCKKNEEKAVVTETLSAKQVANSETTSFTVEGMTCAEGCAKTIENKLASTEGVLKAKVNFDKKSATVQYDSSIQTPEKIVELVEKVADGKTYKVSNVKSSADKAMLYQETPTQEKEKKTKKTKKTTDQASASALPAASCDMKKEEKKAGCCAGKKACAADVKPTSM
jgi:periplasmic mercuric ion binding protein